MNIKILTEAENSLVKSFVSSNKVSSLSELFKVGNIHKGIVTKAYADSSFLINFSGKELRIYSKVKLFAGEKIDVKVIQEKKALELYILNRESNSDGIEEIKLPWSNKYKSPSRLIHNTFESVSIDTSIQKVLQILEVFFPGIEWKEKTKYFDWKFEDGEANAFFGKREDSLGFYLHLSLKYLGEIETFFAWKKEDMSDLVIHVLFENIDAYQIAYEKLSDLKKMLSSNSIFVNHIIFHYSMEQERGNWSA